MFQYAAGHALAARNGMKLTLDATSGFIRDKVYRRTFSLSVFPIQAENLVIACNLFTNRDTIPARWERYMLS